MSNPFKFTPDVLKAIPDWVNSGATSNDIADCLDTTVGSLRVVCSNNGISLRRRGDKVAPIIYGHLRRTLSNEAWEALCAEARRRGMPTVHLALATLEYVSVDALFSAVLDDGRGECESSVVQRR